MKYHYARLFKIFRGEKVLVTDFHPKGLIDCETFRREILDKNLSGYILECPGTDYDGEECEATLEFTRESVGGRTAYFSAKDSSEHAEGCIFASDGKRRIQTNENYIYKDLDPYSVLSHIKRSSGGNTSNTPGHTKESQDNDTKVQRRETNIDGFRFGMVERYLRAKPQWAVRNGVLISHLCICKRTYQFFTDGFFKMEKGDPMVIVGDFFDWFSDRYGYRIAETAYNKAFVLSEHYSGDKENLYVIKTDMMPSVDRTKITALLDDGRSTVIEGSNKRDYKPFVAGAIYEKTIKDYVANRERTMHIFSMYRAEFLIRFDDALKKLDENNLTF